MLLYLMEYLDRLYGLPGFQVVELVTVRAALAAATALLIALLFGKKIIHWLQMQQLEEQVRGDLIVDHAHKTGTPTMGGIIILVSILGATLLWGALGEVYIWLIILTTAWMGVFGFIDDYIKTVKLDKRGLSPRIKVVGQTTLGILLGVVLYFHPQFSDIRSITYLPFIPNGFIDYAALGIIGPVDLTWLLYIGVSVFIITALSNSVNITDGLDGLASGVTAFVSLGLLALTYIAGDSVLSGFLHSIFLPGANELAVFAAAMAAASFGFLWYNAYPANVFMGDTGSLSLGAAVGGTALMAKVELLLPLLGLVYFVEACSVILQTGYFKYSRWRTGAGKRLLPIAPVHHSFESAGMHEKEIVHLFWTVAGVGVLITFLALLIY